MSPYIGSQLLFNVLLKDTVTQEELREQTNNLATNSRPNSASFVPDTTEGETPPADGSVGQMRHGCFSLLLFPAWFFFTGRGCETCDSARSRQVYGQQTGISSTAAQLRELTDSGHFGKLSCRITEVYWKLTHQQEVVLFVLKFYLLSCFSFWWLRKS